MKEGGPRQQLTRIAPEMEMTIGYVGSLAMIVTNIATERVVEITKDIPLGLAQVLQITTDAGIPPSATLTAITGFFMATLVHGNREMNRRS